MKSILRAALIVLLLASCSFAGMIKSKEALNRTNFASYFRDYLGFPYDSHGCLHFTPSDIYLLYKTIPVGTKLAIKPYSDKIPGFNDQSVFFFDECVTSMTEVNNYASFLKSQNISLLVYPALSRLYIMLDGKPYVKVYVHCGPPYDFMMLEDVKKDKPFDRDFMMATPTDPGTYRILGKTDRYLSPTYQEITQLPFGALLKKRKGLWVYRKFTNLVPAPKFIRDDLAQDPVRRYYNYFDEVKDKNGDVVSIRWAGNDFGKYVITWTKDGRTKYPEIGYCAGQLMFEQYDLVSRIAQILTMSGGPDLDALVKSSKAFSDYKNMNDFYSTSGTEGNLGPEEEAFFRLFHGIPLTAKDKVVLDPRLKNAFDLFNSGKVPGSGKARKDTISLYNYLRIYNIVIEKQAKWYKKLKDDWGFWGGLRQELKNEFDEEGIPQEDRKKMVEGWLNERLEFNIVK